MSAQNSNLTAAKYDLVSALSQDTLNASLKAFQQALGNKNIPPITAYYKFSDATHINGTSLMTYDEVQELTNGVDLFAIPNGTSSLVNSQYSSLCNALAAAGFAYAFQATIGLPPEIAPSKMPDIIALNQDDSQTVTYYTYYETFKIMELTYGWNTWTVQQLSQDNYPIDPWIFEWLVDLELSTQRTAAFQDLPTDVQQYLRSAQVNPSTMFSLQQLYLDLNSPRLVQGATATVFNFPSTDNIYASLNEFIGDYWQILQNNGGVILNSAVKPVNTADYPPSSIIPTSVDFVVSPYSDTSKKGLYTLNYLVMSDNRALPSPIAPFGWNWVDSDSVEGIMSVRRDLFISYLNNALSPCLKDICFQPYVDVDFDGSFVLRNNPDSDTLTYTQNTTNPVLSFSFDKSASDEAGLVGALYSASVETKVTSSVTFSGNTIVCTTILTYYADIYTALAHTKGYALATQNVTTFTMDSVGASQSNGGILSISSSAVNTNLVQNSDKDGAYYGGNIDDPSLWAEGITWGAINDYLDVLNGLADVMQGLMNNYNDDIANICTNCLGWTFPGAGSYTFKNPKFSTYNDLTVEISFPMLG
jgi:hypothetical protein